MDNSPYFLMRKVLKKEHLEEKKSKVGCAIKTKRFLGTCEDNLVLELYKHLE